MLDKKTIDEIRADFPALSLKTQSGKNLVYLDNAATTQKPWPVIEAVEAYYRESNANPHRGAHMLAEKATSIYEGAREYLAKHYRARRISEAVFSMNTTDALNTLAYGLALKILQPGDVILISILEHHANLCTWQFVAEQSGAELRYVYLNPDLSLDEEDLEAKISAAGERLKIFSLTGCSNVTATCTDFKRYFDLAREQGAICILDAAQTLSWKHISFRDSGADFIVCSAHKMFGPMGIGLLLGRRELLEQMRPFRYGGDMVKRVREEKTEYAEVPAIFEGGTQNVAAAAGFEAAVRYAAEIGHEEMAAYECALADRAEELISKIPNVEVYRCSSPGSGPLVAFNVKDVHPHDVGTLLNDEGIAIRGGHHCAEPLHSYLGLKSTCRASFSVYNTEEEVEYFAKALAGVRSSMGF